MPATLGNLTCPQCRKTCRADTWMCDCGHEFAIKSHSAKPLSGLLPLIVAYRSLLITCAIVSLGPPLLILLCALADLDPLVTGIAIVYVMPPFLLSQPLSSNSSSGTYNNGLFEGYTSLGPSGITGLLFCIIVWSAIAAAAWLLIRYHRRQNK